MHVEKVEVATKCQDSHRHSESAGEEPTALTTESMIPKRRIRKEARARLARGGVMAVKHKAGSAGASCEKYLRVRGFQVVALIVTATLFPLVPSFEISTGRDISAVLLTTLQKYSWYSAVLYGLP